MEILKRDVEIQFLKRKLSKVKDLKYDEEYLKDIDQLNSDMEFLEQCNIGGEYGSKITIQGNFYQQKKA